MDIFQANQDNDPLADNDALRKRKKASNLGFQKFDIEADEATIKQLN